MASYKHGVYTQEQATSLVPMTETDSGLIVAFGTAPVHKGDVTAVNEPRLCYTLREAVAAFGYSDDWSKYTLCEVIRQHFTYYNMAPIVLVNVLDPTKHKKQITSKLDFSSNEVVIKGEVLLDTLKITLMSGDALADDCVLGTDYTAAYNDDGDVLVTALEDGKLHDVASASATYNVIDHSLVTANEIIGGVDKVTGKATGMELIDEIFPRFGLVPGIIIAPGYSSEPNVGAVMSAKTYNISGHFNAIAIADIPVDAVANYTKASEWKNTNSYTDKNMIVCYPMVKLDKEISHMSTHIASICNRTDADHDNIPYYAPSNKSMKINATCMADGSEVFYSNAQAAYLNQNGIMTAINFIGGWKSWGVQTGAYPGNPDVKDNQVVQRRMFNWVGNTLITTFWSKIDDPANKRLIHSIVDSANIWLNGLTAKGALLGGRVEFREADNTVTDLMAGILYFHVFMTPPAAAREIEFVQEYDPDYISTLFE